VDTATEKDSHYVLCHVLNNKDPRMSEAAASIPQNTKTVNMTTMLDEVKGSDETVTTKTGSSVDSNDYLTAGPRQPAQYTELILEQLARQLEYYFSQANLEKDTYVETLRQLNDGYVPANILQRFAKVQSLVPLDTVDAIVKATTEKSSLLEVALIDSKTGKRVSGDNVNTNCIVAIGSSSGKPLENCVLKAVGFTSTPNTPGTPIQNTIIIRDVDPSIKEEQVRALFDDDECPPVLSLYLDVYNCWCVLASSLLELLIKLFSFCCIDSYLHSLSILPLYRFVTLDTTSRDDMLYAMMSLRSQYLGDEPVKARLKSQVLTVDPAAAPVLPNMPYGNAYGHPSSVVSSQEGGAAPTKGKGRRKKRSKNNSSSNKGNNNNNASKASNSGSDQGNKNGKKNDKQNKNANSSSHQNTKTGKTAATKKAQPKPDLSAASFPALSDGAPKVEVVVDEGSSMSSSASSKKASGSDTASTATSLSSSSSGKQQVVSGGYAAVLLKAKPANTHWDVPKKVRFWKCVFFAV